MRYRIISGSVVEVRDAFFRTGKGEKRGPRKGPSTKRQIERNDRERVKRLARVINCNFGPGDLWLTLTYADNRLPIDRRAAEKELARFLRKAGKLHKAKHGVPLRYIAVTADKNSKTGEPCRLHHHLVMDRMGWELLTELWPKEQMSYKLLDGRRDYTGVARYMMQNVGREKGRRAFSASHGLKKPVITAPYPVARAGSVQLPKGADVREKEVHEDKEEGFFAAYVRYVTPEGTP